MALLVFTHLILSLFRLVGPFIAGLGFLFCFSTATACVRTFRQVEPQDRGWFFFCTLGFASWALAGLFATFDFLFAGYPSPRTWFWGLTGAALFLCAGTQWNRAQKYGR